MAATVAVPVGESPRLARLRADILVDPRATARFWGELSERGTPLMEPIADDPARRSLLTFVWRGDATTRSVCVSVLSWPPGGRATKMLHRLGGSDVWYGASYAVRPGHRTTYSFVVDDPEPEAAVRNRHAIPDPRNRHPLAFIPDPEHPEFVTMFGPRWTLSTVVNAQDAPADCRYVPRGHADTHRVRSEALDNERTVVVYVPEGVGRAQDASLLLVLDGALGYQVDHRYVGVLDRLCASARVGPVIAAFVDEPDHFEVRPREMRFDARFTDFLASELVPYLVSRYRVTPDARGHAICGTSLGGLAAAFAALRHPEVLGNVIAQSPSFDRSAPGEAEPESLARMVASRPALPIRFTLDAGRLEGLLAGSVVERDNEPSLVTATRHLRDVLRAKGYEVYHHEFEGAHDFGSWSMSFEEHLLALWGNA